MHRRRQPARQRPVLEELEPRILFSADAAAGLLDHDRFNGQAEVRTIDASASAAWQTGQVSAEQGRSHELAFIDQRVPDYQLLVDDLVGQNGGERLIEIFLLDPNRDGVEQISEVLRQRHDISAVHLISHGADGQVELGSGALNFDSLLKQATQIKGWGNAFSEDGDLLIYGCDVAATPDGQGLLNALSRLTGADVAASADPTGSTLLGGNWDLEFNAGVIEARLAPSTQAQQQWAGVLATYTVTSIADTADPGTLRWAITQANANALTADTINFNIAGAGVHRIDIGSALPTITGAVTIDGTSEPDYAGTPVVRIDGAAAGFSGISIGAGGGGSTIKGLMITGFTIDGINVAAGANNVTISDNWIGTAGTGTTGYGNSGVGNSDDGIDIAGSNAIITRNVITNNHDEGITIVGSGVTGHLIQGNIIGLDPDGSTGDGNYDVGIAIISGSGNTIGGTTAAARNVISMNWEGIEINTSNNTVRGNYIGTDAGGTLPRGNRSSDGVEIQGSSTGNVIGGEANGAGNLIAFNAHNGVDVVNGTNNAIVRNSIHSNTLLGINLGAAGMTPNDSGDGDPGANNLQNFPVLTSAATNGVQVTITGTLNSTAATSYRIEFYANAAGDGTGYGEGQTLIGISDVTTDGFGNASFSPTFTIAVSAGSAISATVSRLDPGDAPIETSEFAQNVIATIFNTAPVLGNGTLVAVNEDTANPPGQAVSAIFSGQFSDPDAGSSFAGIAVVGNTANAGTQGAWQYSSNGGGNWYAIGTVADGTTALALNSSTLIRFVPVADYNGTPPALVVRGLDNSYVAGFSSTAGSQTRVNVNTTSNGGTTAIAAATANVSTTVNAVNDAPTFASSTGQATIGFAAGATDLVNAVAIQPDGKIVAVGYTQNGGNKDISVARYNADGSLDTSFGGGTGKVTTVIGASDELAKSVFLLADGRILVAGSTYTGASWDMALVRYNVDGSLDASFGASNGIATSGLSADDEGHGIAVQSDGKILVGGKYNYDFGLARFNSNGSLDTSFGASGIVSTDFAGGTDRAYSIALQSDGKVVLGGFAFSGTSFDFALARYNSDGTLDTSFNGTGKVLTDLGTTSSDTGYQLTLQPDGKILLAGWSDAGGTTDFALVRYNSNGSLDTTFNGSGKVTTAIGTGSDLGLSVTVQADGKILVAGQSNTAGNNFAVARYNANGSLDTSFGAGTGKVDTNFGGSSDDRGAAVLVQPDGKIVVAGTSTLNGNYDFAVVRYNTDGTLDTRFNTSDTLGGTVAYTEKAAPVVLDNNVVVFDAELSALNNFSGATLALVRNGGASSQDVYSATGLLAALTPAGNLVFNGTTIGTVSTNSGGTLLLTFNGNAAQTLVNSALRAIAYSNSSAAPPASVQINWTFDDGNTGAQGSGGALTATGSTTVNITAVNDAPTLGNGMLAAVLEDTGSPAGQAVSAIFSGQFSDPDAGSSFAGIAVVGNTANAGTQGAWQYSTNAGGNWYAIGTVADGASALALNSSTLIRFLPVADYNGTPPALVVRGLDNSYLAGFSSTAGSETRVNVNTTSNGSNTAIAAATANLSTSITAVNDAPVITAPATESVAEEMQLLFSVANGNAIVIADVDAGGGLVSVSINITNGTATLASTAGVNTVSGNGTGNISLYGTLASINNALDGLTFVGATDYDEAARIIVSVNDFGNSGPGFVMLDDSHTINVTITPVNDAPLAAADAYTVAEDGTLTVAAPGVLANDRDPDSTDPAFAFAFGTAGALNGEFSNPNGMAFDGAGNLYVADTNNHRIQVFDSAGTHLLSFGVSGTGNGQFNRPSDVAVDSNGNIYVADNDNARIQKFDSAGNHLLTWGSNGTGVGQFKKPVALAVDAANSVYVVDAWNNNVQKFDSLGNHQLTWGSYGTADGQFNTSRSIAIDANGVVWVGESGGERIQQFDTSGNHLLTFGSGGANAGKLNDPAAIAFDGDGNAYIADLFNQRVQIFDAAGNYIMDWGSPGTAAGQFQFPSGVAVDSTGRVWVADANNNRIQVFVAAETRGEPLTAVLVAGPGNAASFILNADGSFTYTPNANWNGTDSFTYTANDGALSSNVVTVSITVTAVNDAPVASGSAMLAAINEDTATPLAATVSSLFSANFSDAKDQVSGGSSANTLAGIAISSYTVDAAKGNWQYSTNGGGSWSTLAGATTTTAITLNAADLLRFVPATNHAGASTALSANLIESGGATITSGASVNLSGVTGGAMRISTDALALAHIVTAVNDAPTNLQTTTTTEGGLRLNADGGNNAYFVADDGGGLLGGLTTVTIEASFSVSTPGADLSPLMSYAAGSLDEELSLFLKSDGRIWFGVDSNGSPIRSTIGTYSQLFDGNLHHVAVSWNSSNGSVAFYVDGQQVETFTGYQTGRTIAGGGALVFGQDQDSVLGGFNTIDVFSGTLYDVRIFSNVRTAGQIAAGHNQTLSPGEAGMIANWTFNDLSITGVTTDAVSGNNLTERHVVGAGFSSSVPALTLRVQENAPNLTVIGSVAAIDPDIGDTFTYALLDNAGGRFAITASNGQITVANASLIDFESASSHNITVRVTDAGLLSYDKVLTIAIVNVNDAPTLGHGTLLSVAEDSASPAGQAVSTIFAVQFADPDAGSSFAGIAVVGNTANAGTQGAWQYSTNGGGNWYAIGTVADGASALALDSSTLIRFLPVADYNGTPPALVVRGVDNSYLAGFSSTAGSETRVNVNTGSNGGTTAIAAATANLSTSITAVNDAPVRTAGSPSAINALEDSANTTAVMLGLGGLVYGTGGGADETGQTLSYKVTAIPSSITLWKADGITAVAANATLTLAELQGLKYKTVADANGGGNLTWTVQDNGGTANGGADTLTETLSVTVNADNDAPSVVTTGTALSYTENTAATAVDPGLAVTDIDSNDLTGAIVRITGNFTSGEDVLAFANQFGITGNYNSTTGIMTLSGTTTVANYEAAMRTVTYANTSDNPNTATRTVSFFADDGIDSSAAATRDIVITAVNDDPVITSNGGGAAAAVSVLENTTTVTTVTSSDVDGGTALYSIGGGADAGKFAINSTSGVLTFLLAPDFEAKASANGDNVYEVSVQLTDGAGGSDVQTLMITVTDENDHEPVITSGQTFVVSEAAANGTSLGFVVATDPDTVGTLQNWTILSGNDAGVFAINASTGELSVVNSSNLNFEATSSYTLWLAVHDGPNMSGGESVEISVADVNDAPTLGDGTLAAVLEDTGSPAGQAVSAIFSGQFSDPDAGSSFAGITVVGNTANAGTQGAWQYSTNGGGNWYAIGTVADGATALALDSSTLIRFVPVADYNGTPPALVVRGLDNSYVAGFSSTAGSETRVNVNTGSNGGTTAIAAATANLSTLITAVNDAPVRTAGTVADLTVLEDSGFTDLGFGSVAYGPGGDADESGQTLSYAVTAIPTGSVGNVYLADGSTLVTTGSYTLAQIQGMQFKAAANASGVTGFQYNVTDSGGTASGGLDGISEFITITVTAVNDAPTMSATALDPGFTEAAGLGTQAAAVSVFSGASVSTVESGQTITGLSFTVSGLVDGANEVIVVDGRTITLGATSSGTTVTNSLAYSATVSAGTATIVLSGGSLSAAATQTLVNGITYQNTNSDNPTAGNRVVTLTQIKDNGGTADGGTDTAIVSIVSTVTVTAANDLPTGTVTITGSATQGQTLSAGNSLTDAEGVGAITYTWQADGTTVGTGTTYVLTEAEVGKVITVVASYTDGHGTAEAVASAATAPVTNVNDLPTGGVTIAGTPTQGQTLTASNTLADADGLGLISYQWRAGGVDISGASASTYVLTEAEVGKVITVVASYTDGHGTAESVTSGATAAVANVNDLPTGSVTIAGTPTQGQTLTASNTLADADGLGTITYQWQADGSDISGAGGSTHVLTQAEVGKVITLVASYTDGHGTAEAATSGATATVANVNDTPTGVVSISGTPTQGQTLTASNTLADVDGLGTISYQWQAGGVDISGASASTYVLTEAEVGKVITVVASYTDGHGTVEAVTSAATAAVANVNDAPTGGVSISGTPTQGQTLTASNTLTDADGLGTISYQWQAGGVDISGASASTYVLTEAEVGKAITVVASYTDGHGTVEAVTSGATTAVANVNDAPSGSVSIAGTATQGQTLTASNTLADADGLGTITYQWQAGGVDISGASALTYVLTEAEVGKVITVVASYTDGHGTLEAVTSGATAAVANLNDAPTGVVSIDNATPTQGDTLTASNTLADVDGLGSITYTWQADGTTVATGTTYVLTEAEVGKVITVVASYTDGHGTVESVTSNATAAVVNLNDAPTLGHGTLAAMAEDTASPAGQMVSVIFSGQFIDPDAGSSFAGIAIVGNTANAGTQGTWQYSTNGGGNWYAIGTVADGASALALDSSTLIRFVPVADYNGTPPALVVRGVDNSYVAGFSSTAGSETRVNVNTTSHGGSTAIAAVTANLSTSITAVNDAPVASGSATLAAINEDTATPPGATVSSLFSANFSDAKDQVSGGSSAKTFAGIAISSYTVDAAKGNWQYSTNGGGNWSTLASATTTTAITLNAADLLRFVPSANYAGAATALAANLIESGGSITSGAVINLSGITGGATLISSATATLSNSVTAVNDAPTAADITINASEDTAFNGSLPVASDVEGDAVSYALGTQGSNGTAVVGNNGSFSYTPAPDFNGADSFTYTVSDPSGASNTYTVTVNVTPVNDPPVITSNGGGASAAISIQEGTTTVTTVTSSDVDGGTAVYSIVVGGDGAHFSIDPGTGVLTFVTAPDFENPVDAGGDNVYDLTVQVSDGAGGSDTQAIAVTVTDLADGIRVTPSVVPLGSETLVNTTTTGTQGSNDLVMQAVASDANGNYVVVWHGHASGAMDVYAQRFSADGTAQGAEFLVNTFAAGNQLFANVAMDAAGNFVIAWQSQGQDGSGTGIYAQRYNAAGVAQGAEFQVNTTTAGNQAAPAIAMASSGTFVIAWTSDDGSSTGIYAQRYNASGIAQGSEFRVNTYTAGAQNMPSAGMDAAGNFVITWTSANAQDGSGTGVYGQRYDVSGAVQGAEFLVNTTTALSQSQADVAMLADGRSVVVWVSPNADGSSEINLQRYAADGSRLGGETRVNATTVSSGLSPLPSVSADASGNIVVVWSSSADGNGTGVVGRRLDWSGMTLGGEFLINTTTAGAQSPGEVVVQPGGGFVVVWVGNGTGDPDGIFMQRYGLSTTEAGGTATFQVVLEAAPTADVVIPVSVSDATEGTVSVASLTFTSANWNVAQTVTVTGVQDYSNDGAQAYTVVLGAASSADANFNALNPADLSVTNIEVANIAPVNLVPGAQTVNEDTAKVFSAGNGNPISISDVDAGSNMVQVALSVSNGTLTLAAGFSGLSFVSGDGTADASMTFTGTIANINTALDGLRFDPTAEFSGAALLTIDTNDLGNSGTGGFRSDIDTVAITVLPVNDAPSAADTTINTTEDTVFNGTLPAAADVEGDVVTYALGTQGSNGAAVVYAGGSFSYTPVLDFNGADSFTYTVSDGNGGSNTYTVTVNVAAVSDAPTGSVTITGTPTQGQALGASNTLADVDGLGTISYQWQADGVDISGASASTYVLTEAEVGRVITVVASYTDGHGTVESVTSGPTAAVANVNDAPTGLVSISGAPAQGQTLTASNTLADADGLGAIAYQWQADGSDISGATADTYLLTASEVGKLITVVASYTDGHGTAEAVTSGPTAAVTNVNEAPTITAASISLKIGEALTLSTANIAATDVDSPIGSLVFAVTELTGGRFELTSYPGLSITSFTYSDLYAGLVRFVHDGSAVAPAFAVSVSDGMSSSSAVVARVSFDILAPGGGVLPNDGSAGGDAGTILAAGEDPVPVALATPPAEQPAEVSTAGGLPGISDLAAGSIEQQLLTSRSLQLLPVQPLPSAAAVALPDGNRPAVVSDGSAIWSLDDYLFRLVSLQLGQTTYGSAGLELAASEIGIDQASREETAAHELSIQTAQVLGVSLTAGAVWWALRVSGLLTSLLASLPAWRQLDLLLILPDDDSPDRGWAADDSDEAARDEEAVGNILATTESEVRR